MLEQYNQINEEINEAEENLETERYGSRTAWARELKVNPQCLQNHTSHLRGITARDAKGRIRHYTYLSETQIREALNSLLDVKECEVAKDGTVVIDGVMGVAISRYSKKNRMTYDTLQTAIQENTIESIGKAVSGTRTVSVYPKHEVDLLPCMKESQKAFEEQMDENGIATIEGRQVICIIPYAKFLRIKYARIQQAIEDATLSPVGKAYNKKTLVDVYDKTKIDCLACVQEKKKTNLDQISADGTILYNGVLCIAVSKYAKHRGVKDRILQREIQENTIPVLGKGMSGTKTVDLYEKMKVDALPCFTNPEVNSQGIVSNKDGVECVALIRYAKACCNVHYQTLMRWIEDSDLQPIGKAKYENGTIDIYVKKDVDALLEKKKSEAPESDESGFFSIDNEEYGNYRSWGRVLDVNHQTIRGRLKNVIGISGRVKGSKVIVNGFYSESQIREACADLLQKKK